MFRVILNIILVMLALLLPVTCGNCSDLSGYTVIKNQLFSISMPKKLNRQYVKRIKKDRIEIFDKASKKSGFGGFAFGIKAYKNPSDHATLPGGKKLGELTDKKGNLYDIVLKHPTDVQYDYTKNTQVPEPFKTLYELGDSITIQGMKGAEYFQNQGTRGEDLYKEILKKHVAAINEKWDSIKLESEDMSYMYNVLNDDKGNVLDKVGYVYYDVNGDGIDELFIGEIAQGNWKGIIYDIYTMVDRKPEHVASGGARNRYFVCDDFFICREYSSSAQESGVVVYDLVENSTQLYPQVSFKYDDYANKTKPWFISYGNEFDEDKWENVSEETFEERKEIFERYNRFDFIPLSKKN